MTAPMGSMASRVPPTKPAALPPSPLPAAPTGLAETLGEGIGEPMTTGAADAEGAGLRGDGVGVAEALVGVDGYGVGVYGG